MLLHVRSLFFLRNTFSLPSGKGGIDSFFPDAFSMWRHLRTQWLSRGLAPPPLHCLSNFWCLLQRWRIRVAVPILWMLTDRPNRWWHSIWCCSLLSGDDESEFGECARCHSISKSAVQVLPNSVHFISLQPLFCIGRLKSLLFQNQLLWDNFPRELPTAICHRRWTVFLRFLADCWACRKRHHRVFGSKTTKFSRSPLSLRLPVLVFADIISSLRCE